MFTGLGSASALAQSSFQAPPSPAAVLLEVPYLPQSVLLCGGAALAMVERWWGRRGVFAEDFASLVRPELGGIRTGDLAAAARSRGWDTEVFTGTLERLRRHLDAGEPVVALVQVAPGRFHYVVVLGWQDGKVTFHDPARSPFTVEGDAEFLTRWSGADRWAMVLRPGAVPARTPDPAVQGPAAALPCAPWLDRAVDAALAKRLDASFALLEEARRACPAEALVLREMAGVRFRQGRHPEAVGLAEAYLAQVPDDEAGWKLLASSRYLAGDREGALVAWNGLGRPTVDLLRIEGTREVPYRDIFGAASLPPGTVLTPARLALARRRVSDVPALRRAVVEYQPVAAGLVEVRVAILERPVMDPLWRLAVAGTVRALAQREGGLEVASPTGGGELWSAEARWKPGRQRAALRLDTPGHFLIPGVLGIEGAWERFRSRLAPGQPALLEETRRSGLVGFSGWLTPALRPSAGLRLERWSERRDYLTVSLGGELRAFGNRFAVSAAAARAVALSAQRSYTRGGARVAWASTPDLRTAAWSARLGIEWTDRSAPPGARPVAGGGVSWAVPLRAHGLNGDVLLAGRTIGHAGVAGDLPIGRSGPLGFAIGGFLDAAKIAGPVVDPSSWYLDGGLGLRIGIGDGRLGVLRVDLARGLVGGRETALSAGMHRSWPFF